MYVVDASISISSSDLEKAKQMIHEFTEDLVTLSGDNRIGVILIRTTAVMYLSLGKYEGLTQVNKDDVLSDIDSITYENHHITNTADGLCKLTEQPWRSDPGVLKVAFILSDGESNHVSMHSEQCRGDTENVANYIHSNHSDILVCAVGIGSDINSKELSLIASRDYVITLGEYGDLQNVGDAFHYQICYTRESNLRQLECNLSISLCAYTTGK